MRRRAVTIRPTSRPYRRRLRGLLASFLLVVSSPVFAVVAVSPARAAAQPGPGSPDAAFGTASAPGMVASTTGDGATGVAYVSTGAHQGELAVSSGSSNAPPQFEIGLFTSSGTVDTGFGAGGFVNAFPGESLAVSSVTTGPAVGDVVAAGWIKPASQVCGANGPDPVIAIAEFTSTGLLNQVVKTDLRTASSCQVGTGQLNAVTVDAAGDIVAAGTTTTSSLAAEGLVVRLIPSSAPGVAPALDSSFARTGYVSTFAVAGGESAAFTSVAVVPPVPGNVAQPTDVNDIVAGGYSVTSTGQALTVAAFRTLDGAPDPNFGTSGATQVPGAFAANGLTVISATALSTTEAPLGNIVAVGPSSSNPSAAVIAQFQANGAADTSFGTNGQVTVQSGAQSPGASYQLNAIAYQPSEGLLTVSGMVTTTNSQPTPPQVQSVLVGQYNAINGASNASFGSPGSNGLVVENGANNEPAAAAAVTMQPDGKTVVAGETPTVNGVEGIGLIRLMGPTVSITNAPTVSVPPVGAPTFQQGTLNFTVTLTTEPLPLTACPVLSVTGPGTLVKSPLTCPAPAIVDIGPSRTGHVMVTVNMAGVPPGSAIGEQVKVMSGNGLFAGPTGTTASGTVQRVFNVVPGAAIGISVGADGSLWVIGTNPVPGGFGIYQRTGSSWSGVSGGATGIAVDPAGNPWVINSYHQILHRVGSAWVPYTGAATDISVGADGTVWVIGTNPVPGGAGIFYLKGTTWVQVPGGAVRIAVDPTGEPWIVNGAHTILES